MASEGRAVQGWIIHPPFTNGSTFSEAVSFDLVVRHLRMLAEIPDVAQRYFPRTQAGRRVAQQFSSFIQQALSYVEAAVAVKGSSATLLQYYAALNLAKAELLTTGEPGILDKELSHGLSYRPLRAQSMRGDTVRVRPGGVFPLLYEKRTGQPLAAGVEFKIPRITRKIPEIGWEAGQIGFEGSDAVGVNYVTAWNDNEIFTVMGIWNSDALRANTHTARMIGRTFRPIQPGPEWKSRYAVSRRHIGGGFSQWYESIGSTPRQPGLNVPSNEELRSEVDRSIANLRPYLERPLSEQFEAGLALSLYASREFVLPTALARYIFVYYASSLVRYNPARINHNLSPIQATLVDAFADQSFLPLLVDALCGIENKVYSYYSPAALRT